MYVYIVLCCIVLYGMRVCVNVCMRVCVYAWMCVCVYVCMCVCVYVCMCDVSWIVAKVWLIIPKNEDETKTSLILVNTDWFPRDLDFWLISEDLARISDRGEQFCRRCALNCKDDLTSIFKPNKMLLKL